MTRTRWKDLMDRVIQGVLLKKLHKDVYAALNMSSKVGEIYDIVFAEISAKNKDPKARFYEGEGGLPVAINHRRLRDIEKIFARNEGQPLASDQIVQFYYEVLPSARAGERIREPRLLS